MRNGVPCGHPASVLVPESALGLLPSIALSSAQAGYEYIGEAPDGEGPFKIDSCTRRFSESQIPGTLSGLN